MSTRTKRAPSGTDPASGPEQRLLLAVSGPDPRPERVEPALLAACDWNETLGSAAAHGLTPQLVRSLPVEVAGVLPGAERKRLALLRLRYAARDRLQVEALRAIAAAFGEAGVPWILLKGLGLAERLYDDPRQRIGCDVDVLVGPAHKEEAIRRLESLGFRSVNRELYERIHFHLPFHRRDAGEHLVVELHWDLSPPHSPIRFDAASWFDSPRTLPLRCGPTALPPAEDELAYVAWHAFNKGHVTLRDLQDIARLCRRNAEDGTLDRCVERCRETEITGFLDQAMLLCRALWGFRAPDGLEPRPRRGGRAWMARHLLSPQAVLASGKRRRSSLATVCYASLLPRRLASPAFLLRKTLVHAEWSVHDAGPWARLRHRASCVLYLLVALAACLLPLPASAYRVRAD